MSGAPDGDRAIGYVGAASVRKASARNPNRAASLRRLVLCLLLALGLNFLHLDAAVFAAPVAPSTSQVADASLAIAHGNGGMLGARHSAGTVILGRD